MIGCAASSTNHVETAPAARLQQLRAQVVRAEMMDRWVRGSYLPHATPGGHIVCSLAIQIDAWYGVGDDRWELTNADIVPELMMPLRASSTMREELARIGIRDCVLDMNR